jgi:hypothetical protein
MDFQSYTGWLATCRCVDCGSAYAARPRDAECRALDMWVTETQCLECFRKLGPPELRGLPSSRDVAVQAGLTPNVELTGLRREELK